MQSHEAAHVAVRRALTGDPAAQMRKSGHASATLNPSLTPSTSTSVFGASWALAALLAAACFTTQRGTNL